MTEIRWKGRRWTKAPTKNPQQLHEQRLVIGSLHDPANVQQTSSKRLALTRVF